METHFVDLQALRLVLSGITSVKTMDDRDLESLKYADLRRLAKEVGLKANLKVDCDYHLT